MHVGTLLDTKQLCVCVGGQQGEHPCHCGVVFDFVSSSIAKGKSLESSEGGLFYSQLNIKKQSKESRVNRQLPTVSPLIPQPSIRNLPVTKGV